jgi:hypothetical protein
MRIALLAGFLLTPLAACSSNPSTGDDDTTSPRLEVTSPERGTMSGSAQVTVTGTATDDTDGLRVTVNRTAAEVGTDGTFAVTLDLAPGVGIIETRAIDADGTEVIDVRAVLAGELAPADGVVSDGLGARIGPGGFSAMGHAIGAAVATVDFTAAGQAVNPVYDNGGCLGATVNITSIDVGGVDVALVPTGGAVDTEVGLTDLVVRLHANYKVACIGGGADLTIRADRVRIHGGLGLALSSGDLTSSLAGVTVGFTGFDLDVGGLPDAVVNLFNGILDDRVASALAGVIRDRVPPLANSALAELAGMAYGVNLLGHQVAVRVTPSQVAVDAAGAFIALDTSLVVTGGEGGEYLASPGAMGTAVLAGSDGIGIAVADDAVNQLFAGLWAAGALDLAIPTDGPIPVAALLDDETVTLDVAMSLPPTMSTTDDILHLALGDVIITGRDAAGEPLQQFALSITTTLAAATSAEGRIQLAVGPPTTWAQVLIQSERVERPIDAQQMEDLIRSLWGVIGPQANNALAEVPMPSIGGVTVGNAEIQSAGGFVVLRAALVAQ